jgi:hypothetical protein
MARCARFVLIATVVGLLGASAVFRGKTAIGAEEDARHGARVVTAPAGIAPAGIAPSSTAAIAESSIARDEGGRSLLSSEIPKEVAEASGPPGRWDRLPLLPRDDLGDEELLQMLESLQRFTDVLQRATASLRERCTEAWAAPRALVRPRGSLAIVDLWLVLNIANRAGVARIEGAYVDQQTVYDEDLEACLVDGITGLEVAVPQTVEGPEGSVLSLPRLPDEDFRIQYGICILKQPPPP